MSIITSQFSDEGVYGAELLSGVRALGRFQNVEQVADRYRILRAYYHSDRVYRELYDLMQFNPADRDRVNPDAHEWQRMRHVKALRNPAHATVEFYAATLLTGDFEIESDNEKIIEPIEQIWGWSNMTRFRPVYSRQLAMLGDQFIKVATRQVDPANENSPVNRVYFQLIDPSLVTWFDTDERSYLTYTRFDFPIWKGDPQAPILWTRTEVWDKANDAFTIWETPGHAATRRLNQLGTPVLQRSIFQMLNDDFVPVVHAKFRDVGEPRGVNAFEHALEPIDEANKLATELHQLLFRFNKPKWGIQSPGRDSDGRSLPPPDIDFGEQDPDTRTIADEEYARLPAGWELADLIPKINYNEALSILQDQMQAIEHYHLPELAYYRINELRDVSGRAIRFMLSGAIDRVLEARANAESALARLDAMALTIGQNAKLFDASLGSYENGDFDHAFKPRPVIPTSDLEESQAELARAQAAAAWVQAGVPIQEVLRYAGVAGMPMSEDNIAALMAEKEQSGANALGRALLDFNAGNTGGTGAGS